MKLKIGGKYTIRFMDHCKGDETLVCEITAWLIREDKNTLYLAWWRVIDTDQVTIDANYEMVSIIKSTIIKSKKMPE